MASLLGAPRSRRLVSLAVAVAVAVSVTGVVGHQRPREAEAAPRKAPAERHASAEARALAKAKSSGRRVEVAAARTATSTTFAEPSGEFTTTITQGPSRVRQKDGSWKPVDVTLRADGQRLVPRVSPVEVSLSGNGRGAIAAMQATKDTSMGLRWPTGLPAPTVEGSTATYAVSDSAELRGTAQRSGFSTRVVLKEPPAAAPVYRFELDLQGLTASLKNGVLSLADGDGRVVAASRPLEMWDARTDAAGDPAHREPVKAELVRSGGGLVLELRPSMEFLTDAARQYPVTIDPDMTAAQNGDSYIYSSGNTTPRYQDYRLVLGKDAAGRVFRTYMNFKTERFTDRNVTSASLDLFQYFAGSCSPRETTIYPVTEHVANSQLVWANQPSITTSSAWAESASFNTGGGSCPDPDDHVQVDVTKIVKGWTSGELDRHGMELRGGSESDISYEKRFCSMNPDSSLTYCNTPATEPQLSISWEPDLGLQPWYSTTDHRLNDRSQLRINNENGNAIIQAQDLRIKGVVNDLAVDRFYNGSTTAAGAFGTGWSMSVGPDVKLKRLSADRYDYVAPSGTVFGTFVRNPSDSSEFYEPEHGGLDATLTDNGDGTFTMTFEKSQDTYTFDNLGCGTCDALMVKDEDRHDNAIVYHYDAYTRQLESITDTAGRTITVTYNSSGYISSLVDASLNPDRTWTYDYTGSHLTSYTDPTGAVTSYDWTGARLTRITDPAQDSGVHPQTTLDYDSGQVTRVGYAHGGGAGEYEFFFAYSTVLSGRCNGEGDYSSDVTDYTDDPGGVTTYCFQNRSEDEDRAVRVVDGVGNAASTSYNPDQSASSGTDPVNDGVTGGSTVFSYNPNGALTQITQPTDNAGDTPGTTFFDYGNPSSVAGGSFLPTSRTTPQGDCTAYEYNANGDMTGVYQGITPSSGNDCTSDKGSATQDSHVEYHANGTPEFAYNDAGNASDPATQTVYSYYGASAGVNEGQLKQVVRPGGNRDCTASSRRLCTSYTYDAASRVATVTDGRGKVTRYSYDNNDRITRVLTNGATSCNLAAGTCTKYDYDGEGNLLSRTDKAGTYAYTYDRLNQLAAYTYPNGDSIETVYNGAGNLLSYTQHLAGPNVTDTVNYDYNAANQAITVADATGKTIISRDANGRRSQVTYPPGTGIAQSWDYTKSGKIKSITISGGSGLASSTYSFKDGDTETDKLQKKTSGGVTTTYGYDKVGRLTSADAESGTDYSYDYDGDGNLTKITKGSATTHLGYNRADELCWVGPNTGTKMATACPATPSGNTSYGNDDAGNNLGPSSGPITYNAANQVSSLTPPSGGSPIWQGYTDQGNDLRVSAGNTTFLRGPLNLTARTVGTAVTFYTRDPDGNLINQRGAAPTRFYLTDERNSVTGMITSSGSTAATLDYDPYGNTTNITGNPGNNPWRYISGYYNTEGDGYYHLNARYYDPRIGRFTQPDSVQGSLNRPDTFNPYLYSIDDPVNYTDANGQNIAGLITGIIAGIVVGFACTYVTYLVGTPWCIVIGAVVGGLVAEIVSIKTS